jgi:hypothetical protein
MLKKMQNMVLKLKLVDQNHLNLILIKLKNGYSNNFLNKKYETLFAIDCSGSVKGQRLYHEKLDKIMDEYYKDCDIIYMWDSEGSISEVGYIKS